MRCKNCGYHIPQGMLYCERCGEELRIVPDYNPLDDMLTSQIKVSINDDLHCQDHLNYKTKTLHDKSHTNRRVVDDREARRRRAEKKREMKRRKRRRLLIIMAVFLTIIIGLSALLYFTSYNAIVKRGDKALRSKEYTVAIEYFEKAISKKPGQADAYKGLSKVYVEKSDFAKAEAVFLDAIAEHPDNSNLYEAVFQFYLDNKQALKIPDLLDKANKKVKKSLEEYQVTVPQYSLDEKKLYDDVQQLSFTSEYKTVYYTMDGSDPTFLSNKYKEPIQLDEGETVIKAFAVNDKGVPSHTVSKKYVIELPVEDAPAVSPSTGQYDEPMKIEIKVPEGYTAYYTLDGTNPTTASMKYKGPIDMPEKDTLFKAILINGAGRSSGITTRNYILEIPETYE